MHTFRCNRCAAVSYSAASLERLNAGSRCMHCGGELTPSAQAPAFRVSRRPGGQASGRYPLRPGARSSAG